MPKLPYIPDTFQLRVEANIINKQQTWTTEEYYDDINNRAALRLLRNNTMDYMIFDYATNQIIYDVSKYNYKFKYIFPRFSSIGTPRWLFIIFIRGNI